MSEHSFEQLNLSPEMARAIADAGYTEMTGIQEKVIPIIREGRDAIGQSSTGTGKTAAFGIPAIEGIDDTENPDPQVLVLCPTRELAMQVSDELRKFSKYKEGIRVVTVYGGQNIETQIRALKRSSIVVGTPGRILDHLRRRTLKLGSIRMAVLDEADEMLDMGFLGDIKQILYNTPKERQTVLFSATMPTEILRITQQFQRNPEHIKGDDGQVAFDLIDQFFVEVPHGKKSQAVRLLFEQYGASRGLIFCNTKVMVDRLARSLTAMGLAAEALHGDMRQSARTHVMQGFKDGTVNMLVATDVAARGIDASGVDIIINYDIPQDIEYYTHRIGRTGRAGRDGAAFTLVAGSGEFFGLRDIEDGTGQSLRPYDLQGLDQVPEDRSSRGGDSGRDRSDRGRDRNRGDSRDRAPSGGGVRPSGTGVNAILSVDVGSEHDITTGQIASAILKYAKVHQRDIGDITLGETESRVEMSADVATRAVRELKDATVSDFLVEFKLVSPGVSSGPESRAETRHVDRRGNPSRPGKSGYRGGRRPRK